MKKFKIKDLLVSLPTDAKAVEFKNCGAKTLLCYQVTLPNCKDRTIIDVCKGGFTYIPCDDRTFVDCKQVTLPDCRDETIVDVCRGNFTRIPCKHNTLIDCNQVTLPDCRDETIIDVCRGNFTKIPCKENTLVDCKTNTGPFCRSETFIDSCFNNTRPICKGGLSYYDERPIPHPFDTRVVTEHIREMDLDELGTLKEQMKFLLNEVEAQEVKFIPDELEDIDVLEKELKKSLEALQDRKSEIKKKKK